MVRPKKVAIIGAGPSGLVTAKTLLHHYPKGRFAPVIFDHRPKVGGLWNASDSSCETKYGLQEFIDPSMRTNLSRFTVSFSDYAWESTSTGANEIALFPQACQVGRYLEGYSERYVPKDVLRLGCRVVRTQRNLTEEGQRWTVEWEKSSEREEVTTREAHSENFDYVVVASGYFAHPHMPSMPGQDSFGGRIIHSSALQDINTLLNSMRQGEKVLVVGGSMSGAEATASIALHRSSAKCSPATSSATTDEKVSVHHISSRPFWAVPTYLPTTDGSFLPLDIVMYDLARRPPGEVQYSLGPVPPQHSMMVHNYFESMLGTDQSDLGGLAVNREEDRKRPPWVAVTDSYAEFVRSGDISVHIGRVSAVRGSSSDELGAVEVEMADAEHSVIENVAVIVLATGFKPFNALSFLPKEVLSSLEYSEDDAVFPIILDEKGTFNSKVPDLGFVGMYRGPYWGVMEMQARSLAERWARDSHDANSINPNENDHVRLLRSVDPRLQRAQFPMGDYVGLMETFARELKIPRTSLSHIGELHDGERSGPVIPARYVTPTGTPETRAEKETFLTLSSLHDIMSGAEDVRQLGYAKAIFRALQGKWRVSRIIRDADRESSSSGIATFYPRYPSDSVHESEYRYMEAPTAPSTENRRALYRFREHLQDNNRSGHIGIWTEAASKGTSAMDLSHIIHFSSAERDDSDNDNQTTHWLYHATGVTPSVGHEQVAGSSVYKYKFGIRGVAITSWEVTMSSNSRETRTKYER